ncbi:MAG: PhnA domain-containing protein [Lutibacter sp.]|jgi:protein PhnA|nr:PhnA domain-containing protein [Lutibacter sp.]
MTVLKALEKRSGSCCELCGSKTFLEVYEVAPTRGGNPDESVLSCEECARQLADPGLTDPNHWRCLNESMWSEVPAVQVIAWRMLTRLRAEGWPADLLDMLYLEAETLEWARSIEREEQAEEEVVHKDVNGLVLQAGDSVVLIKDLPVKGSSMVAKRGTAVRRISLDPDHAAYIEGKVNGQTIVLLTKYVKKTS